MKHSIRTSLLTIFIAATACQSEAERRELGQKIDPRSSYSLEESIARSKGKRDAELQAQLKACSKAPIESWRNLRRAILRDHEATMSTWIDQCHRIRGRIEAIEHYRSFSGGGTRVIIGVGDGRNEPPRLWCHPQDRAKIKSLSTGQQVMVWGVGDDGDDAGPRSEKNLALANCTW